MNDTPQHIKELQLKIWLTKTPGERLNQFIIDNDDMYKALREYKIQNSLSLEAIAPVTDTVKLTPETGIRKKG